MRFFITRGLRLPYRAGAAMALIGITGALLLSGCGGGGSSNSDEGYRFVPEGSGAVSPDQAHNLTFYYNQGSVTSGVIVTAQDVTSTLNLAPPPGADTAPKIAFQIGLSQSNIIFNPAARVALNFPGSGSDPRIYLYQPANGDTPAKWQVLPISTADLGTKPPASLIEATLPAAPNSISTNSYIAVYTSTVPVPPTAAQVP